MTRFYFDYETFLIAPALQAPPPVCVSFAWDDDPARLLHANFERDEFDATLWHALCRPDCVIEAHNAAFEFVVTLAHRPDWVSQLFEKLRKGQWQCTMVREKQIRIARGDRREGFGLNDLCAHYKTGIVLDKSNRWRTRYGDLFDVPVSEWPQEAIDYSLGDVAVRDVSRAQRAQSKPGEYIDHAEQMRAAVALQLTQCRGFMADPTRARELVKSITEGLEKDKEIILAEGLARWQKKSGELVLVKDKKAAEARLVAAYEAQGRQVPRGKVTEKMAAKGAEQGNIKLDEEACELSHDPVLLSYTRYGQAGTLLSKAKRVLAAAEAGKPVQCSYNVLVATGRTSARQGDDPEPGEPYTAYGLQMQNQGRDGQTRRCFVSRPGYCIVSVDYDACEMRTWAQVCLWILGYSDLAEILNNPKRCPHIEMGTRLQGHFNADGKDWREQYTYGYDLKDAKDKRLKPLRGLAKGPNFGLPGGMGALRLMDYCRLNYGVVLSQEEAELACRVWREIYREAQPYLDWVKAQVGHGYGSRGQIVQFVSQRLRGDVGFTDASNGYFQALAADIAKAAGWALVEEAYENKSSPLYGSRPLAFIHDEWLYEIPREKIHEAGHRMAEIMVETARRYCPDVLFSAAPAAMYAWSKEAGDPVYNKHGELIPFEEAA